MSETIKKPRRTSLRGRHSKIAITLGLILAILAMYFWIPTTYAVAITDRELKISDSREGDQGGTGVIYDFQGDHSATLVKCLRLQICTTITGACTVPAGLVTTTGVKDSTNWSGWVAASWTGAFGTNGTIDYTYATGETGGGDYSFSTSGITNPTTSATYYGRVNTYSDTGCTTGVDSGVVAFAILQGGITVSATVRESLTVTISDYAIGFGDLDVANVRYATADELGSNSEPASDLPTTITVTTNAGLGVVITIKDIGNGAGGAGLYSAGASKLIAAVGAETTTVPTAGTEGYAVYGKDAGAGITIDEGFDNDVTGALAIDDLMLPFASSSGALDAKNVDITAKTAISGTTPAGSYSDTLILVATPNY